MALLDYFKGVEVNHDALSRQWFAGPGGAHPAPRSNEKDMPGPSSTLSGRIPRRVLPSSRSGSSLTRVCSILSASRPASSICRNVTDTPENWTKKRSISSRPVFETSGASGSRRPSKWTKEMRNPTSSRSDPARDRLEAIVASSEARSSMTERKSNSRSLLSSSTAAWRTLTSSGANTNSSPAAQTANSAR